MMLPMSVSVDFVYMYATCVQDLYECLFICLPLDQPAGHFPYGNV